MPEHLPSDAATPAAQLDAHIAALDDWRGAALARVRQLIHRADPEVEEAWRWVKPTSPGVPVWEHAGGICTGEVYRDKVKLTFHHGADLADPTGLFNSSLEGRVRRALDIREADHVDEGAFVALIQEAVARNIAARRT